MSLSNETLRWAYEAGYRVLDDGSVRGLRGPRKASPNGSGYLQFSASDPTGRRYVHIHRLAAYQKFGEAKFGEDLRVRHLDGDHGNNSTANLGHAQLNLKHRAAGDVRRSLEMAKSLEDLEAISGGRLAGDAGKTALRDLRTCRAHRRELWIEMEQTK